MSAHDELINKRIENLRPKLLDTTRRNPLVNNVLSGRSASYISIVDEKPQSILELLANERPMRVAPLPPLAEDDLPDEKSSEFINAFEQAKRLDSNFNSEIDGLDFERDEHAYDKQVEIERKLKDKIRDELDMPPRPASSAHSDLIHHARIHGINPALTLPAPDYDAGDNRYEDNNLQTFMLPGNLQSRLGRLLTKQRTFEEDRGLRVTYIVVGYLSWTIPDAPSDQDAFKSPIIVIPVNLSKEKSPEGETFYATQISEAHFNPVLRHKLETDAKLDLSTITAFLDNSDEKCIDIEEFFTLLTDFKPKRSKRWRVLREATLGIYPFQGIDLFHDLNPKGIDFAEFGVLRDLMLGQQSDDGGGEKVDWNEVEVDGLSADKVVPHLVLDADSSQFIALMKVACGENVALEGPPGSGKSQTIVNAIANSLYEGKRILFVAQKLTALEVVHNRLKALDLDKFVLPLVGSKGDAQSFYEALDERVAISSRRHPQKVEELQSQLDRERSTLNEYIALLTSKVDPTELTVHEVMGLTTKNHSVIAELPLALRTIGVDIGSYSKKFGLDELRSCEAEMVGFCKRLESSQIEISSPWADVDISSVDLPALRQVQNAGVIASQRLEAACDGLDEAQGITLGTILESHSADEVSRAMLTAERYLTSVDSSWRQLMHDPSASESTLLEIKSLQERAESVLEANGFESSLGPSLEISVADLELLLQFQSISEKRNIESVLDPEYGSALERRIDELAKLENNASVSDLESLLGSFDLNAVRQALNVAEKWEASGDQLWREVVRSSQESEGLLKTLKKALVGRMELSTRYSLQMEAIENGSAIRDLLPAVLRFMDYAQINVLSSNVVSTVLNDIESQYKAAAEFSDLINAVESENLLIAPQSLLSAKDLLDRLEDQPWLLERIQSSSFYVVVAELERADKLLRSLFQVLGKGQELPPLREIRRAKSVIESAGFFAKLGGEYRTTKASVFQWLGLGAGSSTTKSNLNSDLEELVECARGIYELPIFERYQCISFETRSHIRQLLDRCEVLLREMGQYGVEQGSISRFYNSRSVEDLRRHLEHLARPPTDWQEIHTKTTQLKERLDFISGNRGDLEHAQEFCVISGVKTHRQIRQLETAVDELQQLDEAIYSAKSRLFGRQIELDQEGVDSYLDLIRQINALPSELIDMTLLRTAGATQTTKQIWDAKQILESAGLLQAEYSQVSARSEGTPVSAEVIGGGRLGSAVTDCLRKLRAENKYFSDNRVRVINAAKFCEQAHILSNERLKNAVNVGKTRAEIRRSVEEILVLNKLNEAITDPDRLAEMLALVREGVSYCSELREVAFFDTQSPATSRLKQIAAFGEEVSSLVTQLLIAKDGRVVPHNRKSILESLRVLRQHLSDETGFSNVVVRKNTLDSATRLGLGDLLSCLEREGCLAGADRIVPAALAQLLMQMAERQCGRELLTYSGATLDSAREKLQKVDKELIGLAPKAVAAAAVRQAAPPEGIGFGKKSEYTDMSLIHHELEKKRRISPRKLLKRAQGALLELFPCWMMVPSAVAQHLPRKELFDLVIIDEASQMTPETSISALMRAQQALVSGDTNQLPPSNFFQGLSDNEETDEDLSTSEESILELANTQFHPKHRLQWHYRSKHEELIAFSNHYVYDDDLVIFPSPSARRERMGVSLIQVNGTFQRGINPAESKVMLDHIVNFMIEQPDRSLGVVVMNQAQMEQLDAMVAREAEREPKVAEYIDLWASESEGLQKFFVKNLENVQGDERDVIFIGTVYGCDPDGRFYQRLGPINGPSGKRRLNVLFSRAKEQIITFSSIPLDKFNPGDTNEGARLLKLWLQFSATKRLGERILHSESGGVPDSPFEEHVIEAIESCGFIPVPQVGVSNYYVDIGVRHPEYPLGFLCGVECDGATYHSAKTARDRDRLRQEVLENLGWTLYRIWSTDWFRDPRGETVKLRDYLENLLEEKKRLMPELVCVEGEGFQTGLELFNSEQVTREIADAFPLADNENTDEADDEQLASRSDNKPYETQIGADSRMSVRYLDGARAGMTARFWLVPLNTPESASLDGYARLPLSSPLGAAVEGSREGEIVTYEHEGRSIRVEITEIHNPTNSL